MVVVPSPRPDRPRSPRIPSRPMQVEIMSTIFHCLVAGPPGCVTISSRWDSTRTSRSQRRSSRSRSLSRLRNSAIGELIYQTINDKYRQRYSHMPCRFIKVYQVCSLPNEQKPEPAVLHGLPRPNQSQICRRSSGVRGGRWYRLQPRYKLLFSRVSKSMMAKIVTAAK